MKAVVCRGPGNIKVETFPETQMKGSKVLVKCHYRAANTEEKPVKLSSQLNPSETLKGS